MGDVDKWDSYEKSKLHLNKLLKNDVKIATTFITNHLTQISKDIAKDATKSTALDFLNFMVNINQEISCTILKYLNENISEELETCILKAFTKKITENLDEKEKTVKNLQEFQEIYGNQVLFTLLSIYFFIIFCTIQGRINFKENLHSSVSK